MQKVAADNFFKWNWSKTLLCHNPYLNPYKICHSYRRTRVHKHKLLLSTARMQNEYSFFQDTTECSNSTFETLHEYPVAA